MSRSEVKYYADVLHGYALNNVECANLEEPGYKVIVSVEELRRLEVPLDYEGDNAGDYFIDVIKCLMAMQGKIETDNDAICFNFYNTFRYDASVGLFLYMNEDYFRSLKTTA